MYPTAWCWCWSADSISARPKRLSTPGAFRRESGAYYTSGLTATLGWWWLDPGAATAVAAGAIGVGLVAIEAKSS
jgi:hypothetical protein